MSKQVLDVPYLQKSPPPKKKICLFWIRPTLGNAFTDKANATEKDWKLELLFSHGSKTAGVLLWCKHVTNFDSFVLTWFWTARHCRTYCSRVGRSCIVDDLYLKRGNHGEKSRGNIMIHKYRYLETFKVRTTKLRNNGAPFSPFWTSARFVNWL